MTQGTIRIGISGWTYRPWRGVFYPKALRHKSELAYASRQFASIEINGTFYGLQRPQSFATWVAETPPGFVFAVKAPRFVTHMKKLKDIRVPLANFFASGVLALGDRLGPVLWQLPPQMPYDAERLETFLAMLPHTTAEAARLAREHDSRLVGRSLTECAWKGPVRHALEVRHRSFEAQPFIAQLRRHGVALVVADSVSWPCFGDVTADFVYVRLHGSEELYTSGYDDAALDRWAARVRTWRQGGEVSDLQSFAPAPAPRVPRDVYVYFDNDAKVRAPADAAALAGRLGIVPAE